MTQPLKSSHPTLQKLLEDSGENTVVVLGTGEKETWTSYADSLLKPAAHKVHV